VDVADVFKVMGSKVKVTPGSSGAAEWIWTKSYLFSNSA